MVNYTAMTDDELRAYIAEHESLAEDAQEELDFRFHDRYEKTLAESRPFAEEALAFLKNSGYTFEKHDRYHSSWRCVMYKPPNADDLRLMHVIDAVEESEGFTRLAIGALGNLRVWHDQQQTA